MIPFLRILLAALLAFPCNVLNPLAASAQTRGAPLKLGSPILLSGLRSPPSLIPVPGGFKGGRSLASLAPALALLPRANLSVPAVLAVPAPSALPPVTVTALHLLSETVSRAASNPSSPSSGKKPAILQDKQTWDSFWDRAAAKAAKGPEISAIRNADPSPLSSAPKPSASRNATSVPVSPSINAVAPAAALPLLWWFASRWQEIKQFAIGSAVLVGTYAASRLLRWAVARLGARQGWDPNTTDMAHFVSSLVTWTAGLTVGLREFGAPGPVLASSIGVGVTLAVTETVSNFMHALALLIRKPFMVGETVGIGDTLYTVEDMNLQHITLRVIGKLLHERPSAGPSQPLSELDPLHREADFMGRRYVQRVTGPAGETLLDRFEYNLLAQKPLTIFRPYVRHIPRIAMSRSPWRPLMGAFLKAPKPASGKALLWTALPASFLLALPVAQLRLVWPWFPALLPYLEGGGVFMAAATVAAWLGHFARIFGEKMAMGRHAVAVLKLGLQIAAYAVGGAIAMRVLGLEWLTLTTTFGAAAMAFALAQRDILADVWHGMRRRFSPLMRIGGRIQIGEFAGRLLEINNSHLVIEMDDKSHTLLPHSYANRHPLRSYETAAPATE